MKKEIYISEEFTVDFIKNNNGGKPVGRINGIVAFIDYKCSLIVVPGSTWIVRVVSIHDTFLVIEPLVKVRSPKENNEILAKKIMELKPVKKPRNKVKNNYQYCTAQQLKEQVQ